MTSGTGYITLGTVTADSSMKFVTASASGAQYISIAGIINLNDNTINGVNIGSGTIDSSAFTNPLTFDITLVTDVDILLTNSGNNNIGSASLPLANIYAVTGNFHELTGMSPILTDSFWQKSGTSLEATGINTVQIDRNQLGTQFGNGLTLNSNSISTVGLDKDINVTAATLKSINLNSVVNVGAGNDLYVKDNIHVSGQAFFNSTNITSVTGNFTVNGALSFSSTNELTDNLVRNSNFGIPSGNITGNVTYPANWNVSMANQDFAYGPITNGAEYLTTPAALNTAMNLLNITGNYTIEGNFKKFGNSLFGDNVNQIWAKFTPILADGKQMYIKTNGQVEVGTSAGLLTAPYTLVNNQWYHVAYTWNGTQRTIWVDGVIRAQDGGNGSFQTTTEQRIFSFGANGRNFNGLANNFRISNVARTVFPSGSAAPSGTGIDGSTLGYWKFENNLLDSTPLARNLVQVGPAAGTYSDTGLGQVFSGTVASTGTDSSLAPLTQNVYVGAPHTTNWLLASGNNIDPTGITINQLISDMKPATPYNLSFFQKGFSNFSGLAIDAILSGTNSISGAPIVTSLSSTPNLITSNEWARQSYGFTTNGSGNNFNLKLRVSSPTGVSTTGVFGLTAVQVTEGPAIVPYNKHEKIQQFSLQMANVFSITINAGTGATQTIPDLSRTFFTKGGFCTINAALTPTCSRINAANGQDVDFRPQLILDGRTVAIVANVIPYATANTFPAGGNYDFSGQGNMTYSTYLEPGFHTLETKLQVFAGGSPNVGQWIFRVYNSIYSNVSVMIFE